MYSFIYTYLSIISISILERFDKRGYTTAATASDIDNVIFMHNLAWMRFKHVSYRIPSPQLIIDFPLL